LAVPRLLGVTVAVLCLFVFFDVISIIGGFVAAYVLVDISFAVLLDDFARAVSATDIIVGVVKALFFGTIISLVCLYHGFTAEEAVTSIPPRVSQALVDCFIVCIFFNVMISALFYL
jgi:phospholipid/cholesterol/gamma-HCH transport system permease protein